MVTITVKAVGIDGLKDSTYSRVETKSEEPDRTNIYGSLGPHDKLVELQYFQGEQYVVDNSRYATSFAQPDMRSVVIRNLRDAPEKFSLDQNGFELHNYPTKHQDFSDEESIVSYYYEECHELLRKLYVSKFLTCSNRHRWICHKNTCSILFNPSR